MKLILKQALFALVVTGAAFSPKFARADEMTESCSPLTPAAISTLIATLEDSVAQANADCASFCEGGVYAAAAKTNLDGLNDALGQILGLQTWLVENGLDSPYVTNASAAYGIHGVARETLYLLHHARHWATVSAVYHHSAAARLSIDLTTQAIHQLEALGEAGGLCYLSGYGPYTS
ncbi:MAG TPA: hypothetical protein VFQ61_32680 [Polyangiaceae bacterium]|nr:hypothetical protein [Polyangiaceae bacterium]